jgi:hypothetical protein
MHPGIAPPSVPRAPTVGECLADPAHAGSLDGAERLGEASRDGRVVSIGIWRRDGGELRARFRASACASLIAYAEVACRALEAGAPTDGGALRAAVRGVHPLHQERADLVAAAVHAALTPEGP